MKSFFRNFIMTVILVSIMISVGSASVKHQLNVTVKDYKEFNTYSDYEFYRNSVYNVEDFHATSQKEASDFESNYRYDLNKAKEYFDEKLKKKLERMEEINSNK